MKSFTIASVLAISAIFLALNSARADDGCPNLTGHFADCTSTPATGDEKISITITQSANAQGQTVYVFHSEKAGSAPTDDTVTVNGTTTATKSDGQGVTETDTINTTCTNKAVSQVSDVSINGSAIAHSAVSVNLDDATGLVYQVAIQSFGQSQDLTYACKRQ